MAARLFSRRRRDERGSVMPFVVIVSLGIIMLAALVIDGGRQLNAKGRAIAYAQEAARAGAQAIDVADPRLDLITSQAMQVANTYCRQAMGQDDQLVRCEATITTVTDDAGTFRAVRVTAQVQQPAILLGIINKHILTSSGTALARPVSGITEGDSGKAQTMGPPSVVPPEGGSAPPSSPPPPNVTVPCPTPTTPKPPPNKPGKPPKPPKPTKTTPTPEPTCRTVLPE